MALKTEIAWTQSTLNWWWGCCKVSEGCKFCYAEKDNDRYQLAEWGPGTIRTWIGSAISNSKKFNTLGKKAGEKRKVFTLSMGDFFENHPQLPEFREKAWKQMRQMKNINWLVLTKRPELIMQMLPPDFFSGEYNHVHLGCSCEHEKYVGRLDELRNIPEWGGIRFVSYEPALGPIHHAVDLTNIDWLIYGGESSRSWLGFRKDDDDWARDIQKVCKQSGTVFFYKQNSGLKKNLKKTLDGVQYYHFPDFDKNHGKVSSIKSII